MKLVVQAAALERAAVEQIAERVRASGIARISARAFRVLDAEPQPGLEARCAALGVDCNWIGGERTLADFGLFVTDMDSTLINIECIDEIADMQGLKAEVAAITEAAMQGEIDFRESLTRRVALLAGLPEAALGEVFEQRLQLNPGAEALMAGLKRAGLRTMLVSGGFTYFTERLKAHLGFDHAYANELEIVDGRLTGRVRGEIVDGAAKAAHLLRVRDALGLAPTQTIAVGDGANDIPMLRAAGFGIAYHAKPVLREVADASLSHSGLDGILELFAPA